jgi:riboflavin transporter
MSFKTERRFKMKTEKWSIQKLIYTAMLAAVAGVLMSLEFSVPMMPPFYKVDFSDVPSVIAVFLMGPVSGICVEVIKLLIKLITVGTNTMYVGELANLIAAFLFVWPLWFLYQKLGANRKAAVEALLLSIVIRTACACFINANITLPLYAKAMSLPLDEVIRMVASVNPAIKDLNGFIILATIPFNVLKVGLNYIVGQLLFVRLRAAKIVPKAV